MQVFNNTSTSTWLYSNFIYSKTVVYAFAIMIHVIFYCSRSMSITFFKLGYVLFSQIKIFLSLAKLSWKISWNILVWEFYFILRYFLKTSTKKQYNSPDRDRCSYSHKGMQCNVIKTPRKDNIVVPQDQREYLTSLQGRR